MARGAVKNKVPIAKSAAKKGVSESGKGPDKTRSYMSQEDIPAYELDEALLVAKALIQQYGGHPSTPLDVAAKLWTSPQRAGSFACCAAHL